MFGKGSSKILVKDHLIVGSLPWLYFWGVGAFLFVSIFCSCPRQPITLTVLLVFLQCFMHIIEVHED